MKKITGTSGTFVPKSSPALALTVVCMFTSSAYSAVIIPDKGGFGGYVNLGAGVVDVKSNMLASLLSSKIELGQQTIDNLNESPDSESSAIPAVNFELSYTFENSRTQLHLGNLLEDFIRFDMNTIAGVRQDIGKAGLVGASIQTTSITTEVWSDPYLTGVKRKETDRTGNGFRLNWQQIMGTGFEVRYSKKEEDIDKERSGESLDLSAAQRKLLDRNGDNERIDVFFEYASEDNRHILTPSLSFIDQDRDGDAMSRDGEDVSINYIYVHNQRWRYVFNASYASLDWKAVNPIYGRKDSTDRIGASATVFFSQPFGIKNWALNATVGYFDDDHDIDFYDTSVTAFTVGMFRRF